VASQCKKRRAGNHLKESSIKELRTVLYRTAKSRKPRSTRSEVQSKLYKVCSFWGRERHKSDLSGNSIARSKHHAPGVEAGGDTEEERHRPGT